jgi:glucose/mannose-6-phosphate isomerase
VGFFISINIDVNFDFNEQKYFRFAAYFSFMLELIQSFPQQLSKAVELLSRIQIRKSNQPVQNILISGLGGSGIGGHAVIELCASELKVPVVVNNSYDLPSFVTENTLAILSSYSGNTEEVLFVGESLKSKGINAVCITAGGKLQQIAERNNWDCLLIPSGFPPRTCFGYSVLFQLFVLEQNGLISKKYLTENLNTVELLEKEQTAIQDKAKAVAKKLNNKIFGIFADQWFHSLTVRSKQQFNENSKSLCWANVFPEMNHNELVAWRGKKDLLSILLYRSKLEHPRKTHRLNFSREIIAATGCEVIELDAVGSTHFQQYFYFTHLSDWISFYLAELQNYDPMEIDVLIKLKAHLADLVN